MHACMCFSFLFKRRGDVVTYHHVITLMCGFLCIVVLSCLFKALDLCNVVSSVSLE